MTVVELVSSLGIHLSRHPFALTVVSAILLRLAAGSRDVVPALAVRLLRGSYGAAGGAALLACLLSAGFYASGPQYFDAAEPTMTAIGWLFQAGKPVYHEIDSAERYSHIYGPMAFIVQGAALRIFGAAIETSKWVGAVLVAASLGLSLVVVRRETGGGTALAVVGTCALVLLAFRNYAFWTRPEPLQLFCVAAALLAALASRSLPSVVAAGLAMGVLWNLKITGPLYGAPIVVLLLYRTGARGALAAATVGAIVAVLPFAVFPNVSFALYFTWVRLSAQTGLELTILRQNLGWCAFLAVPLVLAWFSARDGSDPRRDREWRAVALALAAAAGLIIIAASKPGAGPYHLLPLLPILGWLVASRGDSLSSALGRTDLFTLAAAFLGVLATTAVAQQAQFIGVMTGRRALDVSAEIRALAAEYRGAMEMGYAIDDPITFQRPILVFRNDAYLLDQPAVGEHLLAGLELPPATTDALRQCRVNYWLLPKGEPPFSGVNMYPAVRLRPLFPEVFRQAFFARHRLVKSTAHFDVWQCEQGPPDGSTLRTGPRR